MEITDHTNSRYDPGLSLRVIAFQATAGIGCETIVETIRPTVYWNKQPLRLGEVIVGTPIIQSASPPVEASIPQKSGSSEIDLDVRDAPGDSLPADLSGLTEVTKIDNN
ncbi:MAG: hypothetical protein ACRERU_04790 [Methylococcales bacterium]